MCEKPDHPGCPNKGIIAEGFLSLKPMLIKQLQSRGCNEQFSPLTKPARTLFESCSRGGTGYRSYKQFKTDEEAIAFLRKYLGRKGDLFEVTL